MSESRLGNWLNHIPSKYLDPILEKIGLDLQEERKHHRVLPEAGSELTFKAFRLTPFNKVKVVILGQDPYPKGAFNGVAFGNGFPDKPATILQPSLRNIIKEVERTYPGEIVDPSLYSWAEQGVLLLNTAHTVVYANPGTHIDIWADFTKHVLLALSKRDNIVWMLWGKYAHEFDIWVQNTTHHIIKTGHPSPLNRTVPFIGSDCFVQCDTILNKERINW